MTDTWLNQINESSLEQPWQDAGQCDGCVGIQTAADDEVCDHRCDLCKRPLACASVWIEANRGHLSREQLEDVTRVLLPDRSRVYRVRYWSRVLEKGLVTGLMTRKQAEFMAGTMGGAVLKEGEK